MKDERIVVLYEKDEKQQVIDRAAVLGFDDVSSYIRWLVRNDMKKGE